MPRPSGGNVDVVNVTTPIEGAEHFAEFVPHSRTLRPFELVRILSMTLSPHVEERSRTSAYDSPTGAVDELARDLTAEAIWAVASWVVRQGRATDRRPTIVGGESLAERAGEPEPTGRLVEGA